MSDLAASWRARALPVFRSLVDLDVGFYSDDLVDLVGLPDPEHPANSVNGAVGALFVQAGRKGIIAKTGKVRPSRSPQRKGGMVQEWRRVPPGSGPQGTLPL